MAKIDFLTPSSREIRHQIKNVVDSYNNDWDILAELAQNSVDAIRLEKPTKGHVKILIDAPNREITFADNGSGIFPEMMPKLLAPFSSGKNSVELIGNKGVGISFVIFSSSYFEITSHSKLGSSFAKIEGAWSWIDAKSEELPKLDFEEIQSSSEHGTTIKLKIPKECDFPIFSLDFNQIDMILRTKTALGDTNTIWGQKTDKDFVLDYISLNGERITKEIECEYFLPTTNLPKSNYISLREFQEWNNGDKSDLQKRAKIKDKLVYIESFIDKNGRKIKYWACFVPKRKVWDIISVNSNLIGKEILELSPVDRVDQFGDVDYIFSGGMYSSTRGMPTGIRSEMRTKGSGGYLPNFFIILDDPQLSFDIGRKSIPGRQLGMLRDLASEVFKDLLNGIKRYIGGEIDLIEDPWEKGKIFTEIKALPNLSSPNTTFMTRPYSQEASVAAIFFELIGNGNIKGFKPYLSGYKNKYDLYANFKGADVVVEFKQNLTGLFSDFDSEIKLFDQIDIAVIWDVTEQDRAVIKSRGIDLSEVEVGLTLLENENLFHFNMILGPTKPIKVVCIRRIIEK